MFLSWQCAKCLNDNVNDGIACGACGKLRHLKGTITRVFAVRGFGFLIGDDGVERFVHVEGLLNEEDWPEMRSGRRVKFVPRETERGLRAMEVEFVD